MINRILFSRSSAALFSQQSSLLRAATTNFRLTTAASNSTTTGHSTLNETKKQYLLNRFNQNVWLYGSNKLEIYPKSLLPLLQHRNYCSNKRSSTTNIQNADSKSKEQTQTQQSIDPKILLDEDIPPQVSIFTKFKLMYKKYWYVLIPVHLVTSAGWFFGFYLVSQSGVDIPAFMEYVNISDSIIDRVRNSNMGHYAIAYLCYKLVTPIRYAVTLGGTTVSIKYLVRLGYIKPVPSKQEVMDKFKKAKDDFKQDMIQRRDTMVKKATDAANKKSQK